MFTEKRRSSQWPLESFIGEDEHHENDWATIRDCLDNAAAGLTDIAQGWI